MNKYKIGKQFFDEVMEAGKGVGFPTYTCMMVVLERWQREEKANEEVREMLLEDGVEVVLTERGLKLYGFSEQPKGG